MNRCLECNKIINKKSKRCYSCANHYNALKQGKTLIKIYCVDCSKLLSRYDAKRCRPCASRENFRKFGNPAKKLDVRKKMSKIRKGRKLTKSWKKKIKESCKGINKGNKNGMFGIPTPHPKGGKYKDIGMRSSYEIAYAKYLDKNNIKWKYESKRFDLGELTYTPDFYLPKSDKYVEIKGWWRKKDKKRFKLFKSKFKDISIKVLMKNDLQKIGINL